jgi:N6-L-threonylcarbamoyladenine synthase
MRILGIETSCDETALAVVENGKNILSNVIASQIDIHARYGGIVPEVASRQHLLSMIPIYQETIRQAGVQPKTLDAIGVTTGPGLAGSLLVGTNFAKGLALALNLPLVGINHLEGHIYAAWLEDHYQPDIVPGFPLMCLIASGGHTDLLYMKTHGQYQLIGRTLDDAAGEAFDKAARVLGLGFPGGPQIQRIAESADTSELLPRAWLKGTLDFSFSGLKTATMQRAQLLGIYPKKGEDPPKPETINKKHQMNIAAGFQEAVVDVLVAKTLQAATLYECNGIILGGGVAANSMLRSEMDKRATIPVLVPKPVLCTDNGAMVAGAAYFSTRPFIKPSETQLDQDVVPQLRLG